MLRFSPSVKLALVGLASIMPPRSWAAAPGARKGDIGGAGGRQPPPPAPLVSEVMSRRLATRVSLRSRERKLRLFLELNRPGPETTVVDVGVTERSVRRADPATTSSRRSIRGRSGSRGSGTPSSTGSLPLFRR